MMKVLLTAANSFIGSNLGAFLHKQGCAVHGTVRGEKAYSFRPLWMEKSYAMDLQTVEKDSELPFFEGVDTVIHLAHDFGSKMMTVNIEATKWLADRASNAGVRRQIFFSSYSARPDAVSQYGMIKYHLERYFLSKGHIVVRPGLVIGKGGLFLKYFNSIQKYPVIPLPAGGNGEVPIISIKQLCEIIHALVSTSPPKTEINAFYPDMPTMKELVTCMKQVNKSKTLLFPIPILLLRVIVSLGNIPGVELPFDVGGFRSYIINQQRVHQSNIGSVLGTFDSMSDAVAAAVVP